MCCIIIPIYKNILSEHEITSLKQCCAILGKYLIIFVTHKKLDCSVYNIICNENDISFKYEYFNKKYFINISGYNSLLLSKKFYMRFNNFDYMLIYQLDAFVFKDELEYWCNKGYDYIGAPWLKLNALKTMPEFYDPPAVGNGGFSLRNIQKIIEKYRVKLSISSSIHLILSYYNEIKLKSSKNIFYYIPGFFLRIFYKSLKSSFIDSEDVILVNFLQKKGNLPSIREAMKFSFENFPEYLYQLNNEELPFGCHEWFKYYNYFFYKKYIK